MSEIKINHKIEDVMNEKLKGNSLKNAINFVAYMRANEMPPDPDSDNWFKYLGENICVIVLDDAKRWSIYWSNCDVYSNDKEDSQVDELLKEFAWNYENPCGACPCPEYNPAGNRKTIFGKVFEKSCYSTLCFDNPDPVALVYIKKLVEMRKQNIFNLQGIK